MVDNVLNNGAGEKAQKEENKRTQENSAAISSSSANSSSTMFLSFSSILWDNSSISGSSRYGKALSISSMTSFLLSPANMQIKLLSSTVNFVLASEAVPCFLLHNLVLL